MKRRMLVVSLALAALIGIGFTASARAREDVPFKGTLEGSFTATADLPPANNRFLEAEGRATQIGDFTYDFPHSVDRAAVPATGVGIATFTAANGDQIFAYMSGKATLDSPGILLGIEEGTILGGTGRFADASGEFVITRLIDTVNLTTIGTFEGTISSPGVDSH